MKNKVISLFFCLVLAISCLVPAFVPDQYYSETEKRMLQKRPAISWADILSGKFESDTEKYLADQFPLRNGWVTLKMFTERLSGKKEFNGVYFAGDGYYIDKFVTYDEKNFDKNLETLKALQDKLLQEGITLRVMLVPTAAQILQDKLPKNAPNLDQRALYLRAQDAGLNMVDVFGILSAHKDEYIYYRTDHHYTSLGAYYAYCAYCEALGRRPEDLSAFTKEDLCTNFRGTTYNKVNDPLSAYDTITAYYTQTHRAVSYNEGASTSDSIYERKFLDGKDQYAVFFNSNQAQTMVEGNGTGRLLILKDSYANEFAQFPLDDYEQVHMIDLRFFQGSVSDYVAQHGISEVLVLYNIPNFCSDTGVRSAR